MKMVNLKKYLIWFIVWISFLWWYAFASNWTIGDLFTKVWTEWKLIGSNIQDWTVWANQLSNNSVWTNNIINKNVTEEKLSDNILNKINNPSLSEIDPTAVKLTWNQIISWIKKFSNPIVWTNPIEGNHLATKDYVDNNINNWDFVSLIWDEEIDWVKTFMEIPIWVEPNADSNDSSLATTWWVNDKVSANTLWWSDFLKNKIYNFWDYMLAPSNLLKYTQPEAISFCDNLNFWWYNDWRLPNKEEAESISNLYNIIWDFISTSSGESNSSSSLYWTGVEAHSRNYEKGYYVDYSNWDIDITLNNQYYKKFFVRCIRKI
jgi:hypothetical protein